MREPPPDRVHHAFAELTESIDPLLRPPGVESVRETVRRRRQRRVGGVAAAAIAVAGVITLVRLPLMEQPAANVAQPPTVGGTAAHPSVLLPPYAPPTSAPTGPATSPPSTTAPEDDAPDESIPPTQPDGAAIPPANCVSEVIAAATGSQLVISAGPVCPNAEIVVSWVTYETQRDGSQTLFATERHTLSAREPRVTTTLRESSVCVGPWYVLRSNPSIPLIIAAGEVAPFPGDSVLASEDGEICLR
ncbi:hypothetical protein Ais01nite_37710 [Asanoa ishikariensis]|uniref:Uncharacterized protein n=1 Tax=Asanoa ishikariensis TaxID=137265 RepID=A0A1H3LXL9_9ACTN|nr:hypothetical protein [Asanoa ishikariensis]GIF65736.1 hypothetical protein Ais01nite_37710 [Asanoa ishikariensis]SDY68555.1 hypothetical protein SAMN05421684_1009 [Asanoa ishikariensis]